jgi:glycosyltransferase involved in cell wall biosynthesis
MRIAISCNKFRPGGGFERYVLDLAGGLSRLGIRPTVYAKGFDKSLEQYAQIDAVRIWTPRWLGKLRDPVFSWRLSRHGARRDSGAALIACNRIACADLAVCGGTHLGFLRAMDRPAGLGDRMQIHNERRHYAHAKRIVAHSARVATELRELYGVPAEKIVLAYPPVSTARFRPVDIDTRMALRREFGFPEDRYVFLFPSSDHARKGLPALAGAFAASRLPVLLAVAGRPAGQQPANVRYLGFRHDMERLYQAANFSILASTYEPFGLVSVESVLCGTPALMSAEMGAGEVLDDRMAMAFDPHDAHALGAALAQAIARFPSPHGWQDGDTSRFLRYDPDVSVHVRALLDVLAASG